MKAVYVGKLNKGNVVEICKVIDSDIVTGNALVFNRKSKEFEEITIWERVRLVPNIRKLAEDTPDADYRPVKFQKIDGNLFVITIISDSKRFKRTVNEKIYKAIVDEMRVM